jgi:hypothetical protein
MSMDDYNRLQRERRAALLASKSGKSSGGFNSAIPPFRLRRQYWRPDGMPTRLRISPQPSGDLFYEYYSAWVSTSRGLRTVVSNSWNGQRALPCVLDYYALQDENAQMIASPNHVMTITILEEFFKVPKTNKKGYEYFEYVRVLGQDRFNRSLDPDELQSCDQVFGRRLHWSLWDSQKRQFMEALDAALATCGGCNEGELSTYGYSCPTCTTVLANHKESPISERDEVKFSQGRVHCPQCNTDVKAAPEVDCVVKSGYGPAATYNPGCTSPVLRSASEVDLIVKSVPAGKGSTIEIVGVEPHDNDRSLPDWLTAPYEFDLFFGRQALDDQAFVLGRDNPFDVGDQSNLEAYFQTDPNAEDHDSIPF